MDDSSSEGNIKLAQGIEDGFITLEAQRIRVFEINFT
jgi:hypothetical protein